MTVHFGPIAPLLLRRGKTIGLADFGQVITSKSGAEERRCSGRRRR
jgi:hypothetical protein